MINILSKACQQERAADVVETIEPYDIIIWAKDDEGGQLPAPSAQAFGRWLADAWSKFADDEEATVGDVLQGAVSDWVGGRTF